MQFGVKNSKKIGEKKKDEESQTAQTTTIFVVLFAFTKACSVVARLTITVMRF